MDVGDRVVGASSLDQSSCIVLHISKSSGFWHGIGMALAYLLASSIGWIYSLQPLHCIAFNCILTMLEELHSVKCNWRDRSQMKSILFKFKLCLILYILACVIATPKMLSTFSGKADWSSINHP